MVGEPGHREVVRSIVDWLSIAGTRSFGGVGWGYEFPWPNRYFFAPRHLPNAVVTTFAISGLLDAHEILGAPEGLALAEQGGEFLARALNRLNAEGEICFSYTPHDHRWVHNANVLVARSLSRLGRLTARPEWLDLARRAVLFTVHRQRPDGSWRYGELERDSWVDSFHTGFVLDALDDLARDLDDDELRKAAESGYAFWRARLITPMGIPRNTLQQEYPIDSHAVAQSVLTLVRYRRLDDSAEGMAYNAARWAADTLQEPAGWFAYQRHRTHTIRIPFMRWTQAWMQRALTELLWRTSGHE